MPAARFPKADPVAPAAPGDPVVPDPSLTPAYVIAVIVATAGLFATQGWITNGTTKLVTGLAVVFVPLGLAIVHSLVKGRVYQAKVAARAVRGAAR